MIKTILQKEDPALHKVCHPITNFDAKLHTLLKDMTDTLKDSGGLGLAAPQVGILRRVVIVMDDDEQYLELINPEIVSEEGEQEGFECHELVAHFLRLSGGAAEGLVGLAVEIRFAAAHARQAL